MGKERLQQGALVPVVARHDIASRDPIGAQLLSEALAGHVTGRTRRGYESAVKKYIDFCAIRDIVPFPVDELWLAMYILDVATSIKVSSLKVYLSAIQYVQVLEGFEWRLRGNEMVRRAMRFVKRRYPCLSKAPKFPVSTSVLLRMVRYVSGWPRWSLLDHDDLLFVAASSIAVCGFLRGGEFLVYRGSDRQILKQSDVFLRSVGGREAVCVHVSQPKNMWWLQFAAVTCFCPGANSALSPVTALKIYRRFSTVQLQI